MDEVFSSKNFLGLITVVKTSAQESEILSSVCDFLLWYGRDKTRTKYRKLWIAKSLSEPGASEHNRVETHDGSRRKMSSDEQENWSALPPGGRAYRRDNIVSQRPPGDFPVEFEGNVFKPITGYWKTGIDGMAPAYCCAPH